MDGGERAAIGLLFELAVALHLTGASLSVRRTGTGDFQEFDLWITSPSGDLRTQLMQFADADFVLPSPADLVIIQCKASAPSGTVINRSDLSDILEEGSKHLSDMRAGGEARPVTAFIIATNRPLGNDTKTLNADLWSDTPGHPLSPRLAIGDLTPSSLARWSDTVEKWCKRPTCSGISPHMEELAVRLRYLQLNGTSIENALENDLRRIGLFPNEISETVRTWIGTLVTRGKNLSDVQVLLLQDLTGGPQPQPLTLSELQGVSFVLRDQAWTKADLKGTHSSPQPHLPRITMMRKVANGCDEATQNGAGVVLVGEGGTGKSRAIFEATLNLDSDRNRVMYLPWRESPADLLQMVLSPVLSRLLRARGDAGLRLLTRIALAQDSNDPGTLWIAVPDFDRWTDTIPTLLSEFEEITQSVMPLRIRFLLTCRRHVWDTVQRSYRNRKSPWIDVLMDDLDTDEVQDWLSSHGIDLGRSSGPRIGSPLTPTGKSSSESLQALGLLHPLGIGALHNLISSGALGGETFDHRSSAHRKKFMSSCREEFIARLSRHTIEVRVKNTDVETVFDDMYLNREKLATTKWQSWPADFFSGISFERAFMLMEQAEEIGILRREKDVRHWNLPWYMNPEEIL